MVGEFFFFLKRESERERGEEGWEEKRWRRRRNNNLTANDGMPGCYPQHAGLHTEQQLPKSI